MYRMNKGFTLIEMLIVVGMIGILAAGVGSLIGQGPRQSARDSRRKADIESIRSALEIYRNDQGNYPICANAGCLAPTYINPLPVDPTGGNYTYAPVGSCGSGACSYTLTAVLEKTNDPEYQFYTRSNP